MRLILHNEVFENDALLLSKWHRHTRKKKIRVLLSEVTYWIIHHSHLFTTFNIFHHIIFNKVFHITAQLQIWRQLIYIDKQAFFDATQKTFSQVKLYCRPYTNKKLPT